MDPGGRIERVGPPYLAVSIPDGEHIIPVVGLGDLLLWGTLFLGLREQGHRWWAAAGVLSGGLLAALAVGLARGGAFRIPFMAVGAVALSLMARRRGT